MTGVFVTRSPCDFLSNEGVVGRILLHTLTLGLLFRKTFFTFLLTLGGDFRTLLLLAVVTITHAVASFAFAVQRNHVSRNVSRRPITLLHDRNFGGNTVVLCGGHRFVHAVERNDNAPNSGLNETHTDHFTATQLDLGLVGSQDEFWRDNFTPLIIGGIDAVGGGFFVPAHDGFVLRSYHRTEA